MNALTNRQISSLKPQTGERVTLSDKGIRGVRGLSISASYGGTKTFYFRYRNSAGQLKRLRIGSFPSISLADARNKARDYKRKVDEGIDIASLTSKSALSKRTIHTIQQLWEEYHQDALMNKKSAIFESQLWGKHLRAYFGDLDIRSFTRATILDFILPFRRNHSPALSARVQAIISQLGNYAVERRLLEFSPAYQLGKKKKLPSRDRFLNRYELAKFWYSLSSHDLLNEASVSQSLAHAMKLLLLTCTRRGEVAGMEWREVDLYSNIWTIPKTRTKNGRSHVIPLNEDIVSILEETKLTARRANSRFVFPGRRTEEQSKGPGHIRGDAISRACSRLHNELYSNYDIEKFTPHDLRRTAGTYMASTLKVDRFTISQLLNHSSDHGGAPAVTAVYARYDYLDEKNKALKAWAGFIKQNESSFL